MSNAIVIIDIDGYIGDSTKSEIQFAEQLQKPIYSYRKMKERNSNLRYMENSELYND